MLRNQNLALVNSITPAARNAATTVNGTSADLSAVDACTVSFVPGVVTDGTHTPKVQESNDNSSFTDVAAGDQIGTLAVLATGVIQTVVYRGAMRYVRAALTTAGATTGAVAAAVIVKGHNFASDG